MTLPLYARPRRIYDGAPSLPGTGQIHIRGAFTQWGEGSSICVEAEDIGRRTASYTGRGKTMGRHPGKWVDMATHWFRPRIFRSAINPRRGPRSGGCGQERHSDARCERASGRNERHRTSGALHYVYLQVAMSNRRVAMSTRWVAMPTRQVEGATQSFDRRT